MATLAIEAEKKSDSIAPKDTKDLEQSASHAGWGWPSHGWGWGGHSYVQRLQHYGWGGWGHHGHGHHGHHQQHGWGWPVHHGWGWH